MHARQSTLPLTMQILDSSKQLGTQHLDGKLLPFHPRAGKISCLTAVSTTVFNKLRGNLETLPTQALQKHMQMGCVGIILSNLSALHRRSQT